MTPNLFTFDQGQRFCTTQCDLNLASIYIEEDWNQALQTINDGRQELIMQQSQAESVYPWQRKKIIYDRMQPPVPQEAEYYVKIVVVY